MSRAGALKLLLLIVVWTAVFCQDGTVEEVEQESRQLIIRHPYIAQIRDFNGVACSGVLIGEFTVLTAAECVDSLLGRETRPTLWLNATRSDTLPEGAVVRETVQTVIHPNYTGNAVDGNNVALLRMNETSFPLRPIRIAPEMSENLVDPPRTITALGFGRTGFGRPTDNLLQTAIAEVLEPQRCIDGNIGFFEEHMFCVESFFTCAADPGGPVFFARGADPNTDTLFGLTSGTRCFEEIELSGFTNLVLTEQVQWIRNARDVSRFTQLPEPDMEASDSGFEAVASVPDMEEDSLADMLDEEFDD